MGSWGFLIAHLCYNFFYSDSFRKPNIPAVRSVSLICIYVFMKLLVPNGLPYMFLTRKNIKNINSFLSRGLYTLVLATYIHQIWVWNLNSILVHSFIKIFSYMHMFQPLILTFYAYQKLILIQVFLVMKAIWQYQAMIYIEQVIQPTLNMGGFVFTIKIFFCWK